MDIKSNQWVYSKLFGNNWNVDSVPKDSYCDYILPKNAQYLNITKCQLEYTNHKYTCELIKFYDESSNEKFGYIIASATATLGS